MSRSRSDIANTPNLLPDWVEILVPESEEAEYDEKFSNPIVTVPDSIEGLGQLRNWVLDNVAEETVIMIDDDIKYFYCLTGEETRRTDKEEFCHVLINTAVMAKDAGAHVFGFFQTDIRKYKGFDPFSQNGWVGCIIGIIGRKYRFRDDYFKVDIDYCLQCLLIDRIIWMDNRYYANQCRDDNTGGNSKFRTEDKYNESIDTLLKKWGKCLKLRVVKNQKLIKITTSRRQNL